MTIGYIKISSRINPYGHGFCDSKMEAEYHEIQRMTDEDIVAEIQEHRARIVALRAALKNRVEVVQKVLAEDEL
jgi:hypothetical protein